MLFPYKDDNPRILVPYVTYCIIGINALIFVLQFNLGISDPSAEKTFIYRFGFIPADFSLITIFTSMFLHGGISHIIGNMWFLWIFGDNVESVLGHIKYAIFYILCGVIAAITQIVVNPDSQIPMVGASGAIGGILGAYLVNYPKARVLVLIPFGFFSQLIKIRALYVLGFWFILQFISSGGGVAYAAHIGGFVSGMILILFFNKKNRIKKKIYKGPWA